MRITLKENITPELLRIKNEIEKLSKLTIRIGIMGDAGEEKRDEEGNIVKNGKYENGSDKPIDMVTLAAVHEYGTTIKPFNAKWLTIPIHKDARNKRVAKFPGIKFWISPDREYGFAYTVEGGKKKSGKRKSGKKKIRKYLFILLKSTKIPARSFIRSGYDKNANDIKNFSANAVRKIVTEGFDAEMVGNAIGMHIVGLIKRNFEHITPKKSPHGRPIYGGNLTPLVVEGRLRNSISYRLEWE